MEKYRIKCEDQIFEIQCDFVVVNEEGHLDIIIDEVVQGCFCEWSYFYQQTPKKRCLPNEDDLRQAYQQQAQEQQRDEEKQEKRELLIRSLVDYMNAVH